MLIATGAAPLADGAILPRDGAAVPALLARARRDGRGRAGLPARPRGSAETRFSPRERFAGRHHFWRCLKPAPSPSRELCVSPAGSPRQSPKKQRRGRKLCLRRSPRAGEKEFFPEQSRSLSNSCLAATRSRAGRAPSPRSARRRTGPGPSPRRGPAGRSRPLCSGRGKARRCPAGPAPARATTARSGRCQRSPTAASSSFSELRPSVTLNFPVPSAGAAELGAAGDRAVLIAPARPISAGASTRSRDTAAAPRGRSAHPPG